MIRRDVGLARRFIQANREALYTLALYALYFIWWYAFGYGLGSGDPREYAYILGFPAWFFFSCILGFPLLSLALWILLRFFFRNVSLEPHEGDANSARQADQD